MMPPKYHVFLCHRGPDTKRNIVSVLSGMLRSKRIKCFVDYQIRDRTHVPTEIHNAIQSSSVHILILSSDFASSKYCKEEVIQIMETHGAEVTSHEPRKVIAVHYDVPSTLPADDTSHGLSNSNAWDSALKRLHQSAENLNATVKRRKCILFIRITLGKTRGDC
ncbi:hypothetical protein KP509_08G007300 [Ceratopteris richardii]|uniref:ADP-ribosyl cyclase/cyclic ADP-ribose hydrolase n=1 Tax=Ceratopteris richardii TaxID=49495 RepID=A0A8T2UDU0_CERRI|nr:hypothetical protein KP509_08G007300 [Ceratopteris richardii]